MAPGVICSFISDANVTPYTMAGASVPPSVFMHSGKNSVINLDILENHVTRDNVVGYEISDQTFGPAFLHRSINDLDVRLTEAGSLTVCTYAQQNSMELLVHLLSGATVYVRLVFDCAFAPISRPRFDISSSVVSDEKVMTYALSGLPHTPSLFLVDSGTTVSSYESSPAYASVVVKGDDGVRGSSLECSVKIDAALAVGINVESMPFAMMAIDEEQTSFAMLTFPITYTPASTELKFKAPSAHAATDLRAALGIAAGSVLSSIKINGATYLPGEYADEHLAVTADLTLITTAEDWLAGSYDVALDLGRETMAFTVTFESGQEMPVKTEFVTDSAYDAFIPVEHLFPHGHSVVEFVVPDGLSVETVAPGGRFIKIPAEVLSKKTFSITCLVKSVQLCVFDLVVNTRIHILAQTDEEHVALLGENLYSTRSDAAYFWLEEEVSGIVSEGKRGCFQAGSEVEIPGICTISFKGPCLSLNVEPLNASKVPKIRYSCGEGWHKLKFKLRPLAGLDNIVGYAGQTIVTKVQDNDYNPSKIGSKVQYSVNDGPFEATLKLKTSQVTVTGASSGLFTIEPITSFTGQAFMEKIVAKVVSDDGSVEEVMCTGVFIPTSGHATDIKYQKVALSGVTRGTIGAGLTGFLFRGRAYGPGQVAYFPGGLVCVNDDGSYMFSPNLSAAIDTSSPIGDIYCFDGLSGDPRVLSLQYTLLEAGPFFVRGDMDRKFDFNLKLPAGHVISEYRTISTPQAWKSASKKLEWNGGYVQINSAGVGRVRSATPTFTPLIVKIVDSQNKSNVRIANLHVVVCDDAVAATSFHDKVGNLLADKPEGSVLDSYSISQSPQILVGEVASLNNDAAMLAKPDGSFTIWVSSAFVGEIVANYRYTLNDISTPATAVIVGGTAAVAITQRMNSPVGRVDLAIAAPVADDAGSKEQQRQAAVNVAAGRGTPGRRDRSPARWQAIQSFSMYPDGTILPANVVADAGTDNFTPVHVGDRTAFVLNAKSGMVETSTAVFRNVPFVLDAYCQVAALPGLVAPLACLAGAVDVHVDADDLFSLTCENGIVKIHVKMAIDKSLSSLNFRAYGIFRRSVSEPDFVHAVNIEMVAVDYVDEIRYHPEAGISVRAPSELVDVPPLTKLDSGAFTCPVAFNAVMRTSLPSGVCSSRINFFPDETVSDQVCEFGIGLKSFVLTEINSDAAHAPSAPRGLKLLLDVSEGGGGSVLEVVEKAVGIVTGILGGDKAEITKQILRSGPSDGADAGVSVKDRVKALKQRKAEMRNEAALAPTAAPAPVTTSTPAPTAEPEAAAETALPARELHVDAPKPATQETARDRVAHIRARAKRSVSPSAQQTAPSAQEQTAPSAQQTAPSAQPEEPKITSVTTAMEDRLMIQETPVVRPVQKAHPSATAAELRRKVAQRQTHAPVPEPVPVPTPIEMPTAEPVLAPLSTPTAVPKEVPAVPEEVPAVPEEAQVPAKRDLPVRVDELARDQMHADEPVHVQVSRASPPVRRTSSPPVRRTALPPRPSVVPDNMRPRMYLEQFLSLQDLPEPVQRPLAADAGEPSPVRIVSPPRPLSPPRVPMTRTFVEPEYDDEKRVTVQRQIPVQKSSWTPAKRPAAPAAHTAQTRGQTTGTRGQTIIAPASSAIPVSGSESFEETLERVKKTLAGQAPAQLQTQASSLAGLESLHLRGMMTRAIAQLPPTPRITIVADFAATRSAAAAATSAVAATPAAATATPAAAATSRVTNLNLKAGTQKLIHSTLAAAGKAPRPAVLPTPVVPPTPPVVPPTPAVPLTITTTSASESIPTQDLNVNLGIFVPADVFGDELAISFTLSGNCAVAALPGGVVFIGTGRCVSQTSTKRLNINVTNGLNVNALTYNNYIAYESTTSLLQAGTITDVWTASYINASRIVAKLGPGNVITHNRLERGFTIGYTVGGKLMILQVV
jgi:hypothetical protein